jgi:hypothetical protein
MQSGAVLLTPLVKLQRRPIPDDLAIDAQCMAYLYKKKCK